MREKIITLLASVFLANCSSIPSDAPKEFQEADSSIKTMEENKGDVLFPKTAKKAKSTFESALDILKKSSAQDVEEKAVGVKRKNVIEGDDKTVVQIFKSPSSTKENAVAKAVEAKNLADKVNKLQEKISSWENDQDKFKTIFTSLEELENGTSKENTTTILESPFAKLKNSEIVTTLAYFDTGISDAPKMKGNELDYLVKILNKDSNYQVIVTGYADFRGESQFNYNLALNRAQTIAKKLVESGASEDQIVVISEGSKKASDTPDQGKQLLDRKVQAKLILK